MAERRSYHFELLGTASSNPGFFTKCSDAGLVANPSGKPVTYAYDTISNGASSGYKTGGKKEVVASIYLEFAGAAVSTGTVGTPKVRIHFYKNLYSSRTDLGYVDVAISSTGVGTYNDVWGAGATGFQQVTKHAVKNNSSDDIVLDENCNWGIEFDNVSGSNDGINAIRVVTIKVETVQR